MINSTKYSIVCHKKLTKKIKELRHCLLKRFSSVSDIFVFFYPPPPRPQPPNLPPAPNPQPPNPPTPISMLFWLQNLLNILNITYSTLKRGEGGIYRIQCNFTENEGKTTDYS